MKKRIGRSRLKNFVTLADEYQTLDIYVKDVILRPANEQYSQYIGYYFQAASVQQLVDELAAVYSGEKFVQSLLELEIGMPRALTAFLRRFRRQLNQTEHLVRLKQDYYSELERYYNRLYDDYFIGRAACDDWLKNTPSRQFKQLPEKWRLRRLAWLGDSWNNQCNMAEVLPEYRELYLKSSHVRAGKSVHIPLPPLKQQRLIVRHLKKLNDKRQKMLATIDEQLLLLDEYRVALFEDLAAQKF